jgi:hypothetical protein
MNYIFLFALLVAGLASCLGPIKTENDNIRNQILSNGKSIVWALNEGNVDTLMSQYWQSDSAFFMINGRKIQGYDQIENRLTESLKYRKKLELDALIEDVLILSPTSAVHVIEFHQIITDLTDSTSTYRGAWTTVYQKINEDWKAVFVHESYYPANIN